jgi:hypothetical protein
MYDFSVHHNFFIHNNRRNPWFEEIKCAEVVNNVVYNWGNRVGVTIDESCVDYVANYYKPGPWSARAHVLEHRYLLTNNQVLDPKYLYVAENFAEHLPNAAQRDLVQYANDKNGPLPGSAFTSAPQSRPTVPTRGLGTYEVVPQVLSEAGANRRLACDGTWLAARDQTDNLFVSDAENGTAPVADHNDADHQDDYGGFPVLRSGQPCADTDGDGMPDDFETAKFGGPTIGDPAADSDGDGYTNMEEYLNGTEPT